MSLQEPNYGCAPSMLTSQGIFTILRSSMCVATDLTCRSTPKRGRDGEYCAEKTESPLMNCITLLQPRVALAEWKNGPLTVINYVRRTLQPIVLQCASEDLQFGEDEYIVSKKAKSVVCMPILLKNTLKVFNLYILERLFISFKDNTIYTS